MITKISSLSLWIYVDDDNNNNNNKEIGKI
jgi:hypothetical protein